MKDQIYESISLCEGRIANGTAIEKAFEWMKEEVEQILDGVEVHDID